MIMMDFFKYLINGVQTGGIYALVALGYTMVYGIVKLINFAHGDFIMVGGYVALVSSAALAGAGLPLYLCIPLAILFCSVLGVVTERVAYKPLRGAPKISVLITAIGVSLLLENLVQVFFSPNPQPFRQIFPNTILRFGELQLSTNTVITILLSLGLMVALHLFIQKTKLGRAMRAVSEDEGAARLMGINVSSTISLTFAIGSGLAAVAAILYCSAYPQVEPMMGSILGLKAFVAAVLGGIGILPGAMLGGLLMGIIESLTKAYISSQLADAVVFGILILVLLVRPAGLFGKTVREKV